MVTTVILNGRMLRDRDLAHSYLARMMSLPEYYGRNLDALYDCLTACSGCTILLLGAEALRREGGYGGKILAVFEDAALENPALTLVFDGKEDGR